MAPDDGGLVRIHGVDGPPGRKDDSAAAEVPAAVDFAVIFQAPLDSRGAAAAPVGKSGRSRRAKQPERATEEPAWKDQEEIAWRTHLSMFASGGSMRPGAGRFRGRAGLTGILGPIPRRRLVQGRKTPLRV